MNLLLHIIFFVSGIAGLSLEIVWTRMLAIGLGHELPSMLAVVAAFFGGLAIGAWGMDRVVSRSPAPGRWYVVFELAVALWALVSIFLIPQLNRWIAHLIGIDPDPIRYWMAALSVSFIGLLPATAAMGATLAAMERLVSRLQCRQRTVAGLYGANTAGALVGTLATTFLIVPLFGFRTTLIMLAILNCLCALSIAWGPVPLVLKQPRTVKDVPPPPGELQIGLILFSTGLLGIGYQVLMVRVMAQVLENTVYSFASALSAYLLATCLGAFFYQQFLRKAPFNALLTRLLQWICISCLACTVVVQYSHTIYETCQAYLGGGFLGSILAEISLALMVFLVPAFLMGATFSHLTQFARHGSGGIGRSFGLNTFGSAMAPLVFGVMLMPVLGTKWTLVLIAITYLVFLPFSQVKIRQLWPSAVILPLIWIVPSQLMLVTPPQGGKIIQYREGLRASVAVVEHRQGWRMLKVNNRFDMGSTASPFAEMRMAHIPLLLHPNPGRVLFLGVGTGVTARTATGHAEIAVDAVELIPEVIGMIPFFESPRSQSIKAKTLNYRVADARRFVRATRGTYDVIIGDLFHAARDGSGALYTREHFQAIRQRLNKGGLFCQWLPLHQLDLPTVQVIVKTFLTVFPHTQAYMAHYNIDTPLLGLVGAQTPISYPPDWYRRRVKDRRMVGRLSRVALAGDLSLLGCLLGDRMDLMRFTAGRKQINTDNHPLVTFLAPEFAYRKDQPRFGRLETLLKAFNPSVEEIVAGDGPEEKAFASRLRRYLSARNRFLEGMMLLDRGKPPEALRAYLESIEISPEFRTAVVMLWKIANDTRQSDPETSLKIRTALKRAKTH